MNIIYNCENFIPLYFVHDKRFNHAYIDIRYNDIDYYELIYDVCEECTDNDYKHALNRLLTSDKFYEKFGNINNYNVMYVSDSSDLYSSKSCYVLVKRE